MHIVALCQDDSDQPEKETDRRVRGTDLGGAAAPVTERLLGAHSGLGRAVRLLRAYFPWPVWNYLLVGSEWGWGREGTSGGETK